MEGTPFDDERCQSFVKNLDKMLDAFGWKKADLARESNYSASLISEIMAFKRWPAVQHGEAFDRAFGLDDVFAAKARAIRADGYPDAFRDFPAHEATAHDLYLYQHSVFPGLIQTERYARAVLSAWPNITADEVERRVTGRLMRQEVLTRLEPQPPRLWALVDEAALRRPVAAPRGDVRAVHARPGGLATVAREPGSDPLSRAVACRAARRVHGRRAGRHPAYRERGGHRGWRAVGRPGDRQEGGATIQGAAARVPAWRGLAGHHREDG